MRIKNYNPQISNSSIAYRIESLLFYSLILFLPTQLGKHFWPDFSSVLGTRIDYLSPTIYLTDVLIGLLSIFWLMRILRKKLGKNSKVIHSATLPAGRQGSGRETQNSKIQLKIRTSSPFLIWLFVIGYLLFVILFSGRIAGGMYILWKYAEMSFVAYYIAKFAYHKTSFGKIQMIFSFAVVFESLLAIVQFVFHRSIGGLIYFLGERTFNGSTPGIANASLNGELVLRPYGTFPHPNVMAGYLLIAMILVIFNLGNTNKFKNKLLRGIALFLGTISLLLTMSRAAIVLWLIVTMCYLVSRAKSKLLPLVLTMIIVLIVLSPLGSRFTSIRQSDEAVVQREELINSSITMIKEKPLVGVGLGNFLSTLPDYQKPQSAGYFQPVHNIFLLVAAETGLIGLGFFLWFLFKTFKRIKKQELRIREMQFIALSAILIIGLFDHYWLTLQQGQLLFAFIIGLCWAKRITS